MKAGPIGTVHYPTISFTLHVFMLQGRRHRHGMIRSRALGDGALYRRGAHGLAGRVVVRVSEFPLNDRWDPAWLVLVGRIRASPPDHPFLLASG
jgi:hypothetical protein